MAIECVCCRCKYNRLYQLSKKLGQEFRAVRGTDGSVTVWFDETERAWLAYLTGKCESVESAAEQQKSWPRQNPKTMAVNG